ncbi:MAG: hypothetical protein JRH06_05560 [Deltaproteobacteria bacterium]|nr:hypothetical protein [Deltaproteobacteria bacterium]MBW2137005.1 hypothetical protein [Deltaproteobacteria bacterium]
MEVVKDVKMTVQIRTDKRQLEKDFDNLFDLKVFMDNFFSNFADRRSVKPAFRYVGPERRMKA